MGLKSGEGIHQNTMSKPKLVIVTNGNYFARLISEPLLLDDRWKVAGIVIVSGDYYGRSMINASFHLAKKTAFPYLVYKVFTIMLFKFLSLIGRDKFSVLSLVKSLHIPVLISQRVNDKKVIEWVSGLEPDLLISVSCPQRIKKSLLSVPKVAAINIHSSILPRYAGLAPYFWVLAMGEKETGITVHYMIEQLDEGNILSQSRLDILPKESAFSLFRRLSYLGAKTLIQGVERALSGDAGSPQDMRQRAYFSHPSSEAYRRMKKNGHSLIKLKDIVGLLISKNKLI